MKRTYQVSGITCEGCEAKIKYLFSSIEGVSEVVVDIPTGKTSVEMQHDISLVAFQEVLKPFPKYQIMGQASLQSIENEKPKSWFVTYTPILLIFGYITTVAFLVSFRTKFDYMLFMNVFMAGFFLVFSFFKMLNLSAFAESYAMYDIIAQKWKGWGYVYAFVELGLGLAYLTHFNQLITNWVTLVVMSVSIIGVLQSVLNKQKIRCACLGAVFNLPMSTVTIIEDALMIAMSAAMLWLM